MATARKRKKKKHFSRLLSVLRTCICMFMYKLMFIFVLLFLSHFPLLQCLYSQESYIYGGISTLSFWVIKQSIVIVDKLWHKLFDCIISMRREIQKALNSSNSSCLVASIKPYHDFCCCFFSLQMRFLNSRTTLASCARSMLNYRIDLLTWIGATRWR